APLSDADLSDKFLELTADAIGAQEAKALLEALWKSNALPGIVKLRSQTALRAAE
ncbi:MAG: hypothetical protein INF54_10680, partial [Roseomonas sp.]|nr:hypothetical protein [Roseomonas sp.]